MEELIRKLQEDHQKIDEVLFQLEKNFENCQPSTFADKTQLSLLNDAINFVIDFPKHWHHPIEEEIFTLLLKKNTASDEAISTILDEHHNMEEEFREVIESFNRVAEEGGRPSGELLVRIETFIQHQLDHQHREASVVYPLITRYLNEREWQDIQQFTYQLPRNQPLQQHFAAIYERLMQASRRYQREAAFPKSPRY